MSVHIQRYKKDLFETYTIGYYPTLELLKLHPELATKVILSTKSEESKGAEEIIRICDEKNIYYETSDRALKILSDKDNVYAAGFFSKFYPEIEPNENTVVLINPSSLGNLGTIIRTMVGFNVNNLAIIGNSADIFHPDVVRSSMGALFKIKFKYFDSFQEFSKYSNTTKYFFTTDGKILERDNKYKNPFSLIFGNEGSGILKELSDNNIKVRLPMSDKIDSYNLSVSVALALYNSIN